MDWLDSLGNAAQLISVVGGAIVAVVVYIFRLNRRIDALEAKIESMGETIESHLRQIMSQPVDIRSMKDSMTKIHSRLDEISKDVHYLSGRFEEHNARIRHES